MSWSQWFPSAKYKEVSNGTSTHFDRRHNTGRVNGLALPNKTAPIGYLARNCGALSFWLPDVAVHISAGPNFDSRHVWVITILSPAAFLLTYVVARKFSLKRDFRWAGAAMLLGVWITGGLFMTIAAMASGSEFVGVNGVWRLVIIVLSVIPIVTYILATFDGSVFALLVVTLGALLLWGFRASLILLTSRPSL